MISFAKVRVFGQEQTEYDCRHRLSPKYMHIFERDGFRCHYCGADTPLTVDHIVPRSRGGSEADSNLVTACRSCNSSKRNKSYDEFIEWREAELVAFQTFCENQVCL